MLKRREFPYECRRQQGFYPIPIRPNVKNGIAKGKKKSRETSDMMESQQNTRNEQKGDDMQIFRFFAFCWLKNIREYTPTKELTY